MNGVALGRGRGRIELVTAPGLSHGSVCARGRPMTSSSPIFSPGPLIELAPVLGGALLPGGSLILAGLLDTQAAAVAAAYRREGLRLADRITLGDWPTLRLVKRRIY